MIDPATPEALRIIADLMMAETYKPDEQGIEALCIMNAANDMERLIEKCNMQANMLRRLTPDKYPDTLFIHALLGERDQNNMPQKLLVVPAYGVDFSYVYERTETTTGPKW